MSRPQSQNHNPAACAGIETNSSNTELPAASERRRSPRQTFVAKAVIRAEANAAAVTVGFTSNISTLGIGLHTRRPLPVGETFQMHVELGPVKWAARLRVVSCKLHGGTWDVGAEFVESDSAAAAPLAMAA